MFTEDVIEKMIIDTLVKNGWEYVPAEKLPRSYTDVMVEPHGSRCVNTSES